MRGEDDDGFGFDVLGDVLANGLEAGVDRVIGVFEDCGPAEIAINHWF